MWLAFYRKCSDNVDLHNAFLCLNSYDYEHTTIHIIDLSLLLGGVSFILEKKTNTQDYFGYEQPTIPTSFFKDNLMR